MTPTLDALVRQLREATDAALVPPHPKQALANEWKPHMTVNPHDMATLLDALTAAQTQRTSPITRLHNLVDGLSYCDDCAAPACDDDKPEGPHILCHDCAVKHKQAEAETARLREQNQCDACMGTGTPISGKPCMCHGTGLMRVAALHLREQVSALQGELAEAQQQLDVMDQEVSRVYDHLTRGRISYSDTNAQAVISTVEDLQTQDIDEAIKEATDELRAERDAAREALRQILLRMEH